MLLRIVIDTNVLVAALRSRRGASFRLPQLVGQGRFEIVLTVPLVLEYEDAMSRHLDDAAMRSAGLQGFLDYLCSIARQQSISFLWRPRLRDPRDELVLEAAVAGECDGIVTFNVRDFAGVERFGLWVEAPQVFLRRIGALP